MLRIDCALIINRPPIFYNIEESRLEFLKYRFQFHKRYVHNPYPYARRVKSLVGEDSDYLRDIVRLNKYNLDNYPTHQVVHREED